MHTTNQILLMNYFKLILTCRQRDSVKTYIYIGLNPDKDYFEKKSNKLPNRIAMKLPIQIILQ